MMSIKTYNERGSNNRSAMKRALVGINDGSMLNHEIDYMTVVVLNSYRQRRVTPLVANLHWTVFRQEEIDRYSIVHFGRIMKSIASIFISYG